MGHRRSGAAVFVCTAVIQKFQQTELVAVGQVKLQGLGQVGNFALFFGQGNGQSQKVAG